MDKWEPTVEEKLIKQLSDKAGHSFTMAINSAMTSSGIDVRSSPTISDEALSQLLSRVETTNEGDNAIIRLVIERLSL